MKKVGSLSDAEKEILLSLFYSSPDGPSDFMSLREASRSVGDRFHPDKLKTLAVKMQQLGYGQGMLHEIETKVDDVSFKLNQRGYEQALLLTEARRSRPWSERVSSINWSTVAAIVAAVAAVIAAYLASKVKR